jgi:subtilisin family serine protease
MKLHTLATLSLGALMACSAVTAFAQKAVRSPYVVQLTDAPIAAYEGGIPGLAATKPAAGQKLDMLSSRVQAYSAYLNTRVNAVTSKVPAANVYYRYGVVVNGFAAMLTPGELRLLRSDPSVKAISADEPMPLDTSYTTSQFLGLGAPGGAWSRKDANGNDIKGENIIVAMVDTGVWPENPSVSDKVGANGKPVPYHAAGTVVYDPLPAGRYRGTCQVGEAFTAAMCNNKLVGAQAFQATFLLVNPTNVWPGEYLSPRDEDGHGSHTLTTAGGNANSPVTVAGADFEITGVAPRARLAAYKACNSYINASGVRQNSCYTGDTMAAINKAVADGVDVINYSIGGDQTSVGGLIAQAMLGAAKAGVFVAASAGNSGPGNQVAHVGPWVATVGNSTHDRYTEANVTLGNGTVVRGGSWQTQGLSSRGMILSRDAGVTPYANLTTDADRLALQRCYNAADRVDPALRVGGVSPTAASLLDPAKVAGKILVCIRGGNVFVNKVDVAKSNGASGVIFQNVTAAFSAPAGASANSVFALALALPAVHLPASTDAAVLNYGATGNPTAAIAGATAVAGVVAPQMSGSSSRGPNKFDVNVLKPDITAPGTDIIAGYTASDVTAAERAALIAGTQVGRPGATAISGTSMSSPHVAGAAALLKQLNPTWSQAAIKSALMTSATQNVKLANGAADNDRWGYGSGHLTPNAALSTSLVYDISNAQYDAYTGLGSNGLGLNLASITFGNVLGQQTTTRTLSNKGTSPVTLSASATLPGFDVTVTPASLTIPAGGTGSYSVNVARQSATPFNSYRFGNLTWTGGGQTIVSPLTARGSALVAQSSVNDTRAVGSRIFTIGTGFAGPMVTTQSGMVAATRRAGTVLEGEETCFPVVVPASALAIRVQLFGGETTAPDLDITLKNPGGTVIAASESGTSDEVITVGSPAAGTYSACVQGYATGSLAPVGFNVSTWVVPTPVGPQTLLAAGPSTAYLGGTASIVARWNTAPGTRSFGVVQYRQSAAGAVLGTTNIFVDASGLVPAVVLAPVLSSKTSRMDR